MTYQLVLESCTNIYLQNILFFSYAVVVERPRFQVSFPGFYGNPKRLPQVVNDVHKLNFAVLFRRRKIRDKNAHDVAVEILRFSRRCPHDLNEKARLFKSFNNLPAVYWIFIFRSELFRDCF